jgi:hypothetical protein
MRKKKVIYFIAIVFLALMILLCLSFGISGWALVGLVGLYLSMEIFILSQLFGWNKKIKYVDLQKLRKEEVIKPVRMPTLNPVEFPILEGNGLICEFMGEVHQYDLDKVIRCTYNDAFISGKNPTGAVWEEVKYHRSWDELFPVIKKLNEYAFQDRLNPASPYYFSSIIWALHNLEIEETWRKVVVYISKIKNYTYESS